MRGLLKRLLGSVPVTKAFARTRSRRIIALCYHDLRDPDDFTNWLRISRDEFDRHLAGLKRLAHFISLDDLDAPESLDPDIVHILLTFDDGYANNLRLALPLLIQHQVPAVFFISTRNMVEQRPFRADLLLTPVQALQLETLDLRPFGLELYHFRAGDGPERWESLRHLLEDVKGVGNDDHPGVAAILEHMQKTFGPVLAENLPRFHPLSGTELQRLAASPWVRLGSHSHYHRILTRVDDEGLWEDLIRSRDILTEYGGRPPTDLAYPNGDWDERVAAMAMKAGYIRGWTTSAGSFWTDSPPMCLPRIMVGGYDRPGTLRYMLNRSLLSRPTG